VEGVSSFTPQPYYAPKQNILPQPLYYKPSDNDTAKIRNETFTNQEIPTASLNPSTEIHDTPNATSLNPGSEINDIPNTTSLSSSSYYDPNNQVNLYNWHQPLSRTSSMSSLTDSGISYLHTPQDISLTSRQTPSVVTLISEQTPSKISLNSDHEFSPSLSLSSFKSAQSDKENHNESITTSHEEFKNPDEYITTTHEEFKDPTISSGDEMKDDEEKKIQDDIDIENNKLKQKEEDEKKRKEQFDEEKKERYKKIQDDIDIENAKLNKMKEDKIKYDEIIERLENDKNEMIGKTNPIRREINKILMDFNITGSLKNLKDRKKIIDHLKKNINPLIDKSIDGQEKIALEKMESEIRYPPSTSGNIVRINKDDDNVNDPIPSQPIFV